MQPSQWEIVVLKPTKVFESFLISQVGEELSPNLQQLQTDTTAYVIPKRASDEETLDEIEKHYITMFSHEIRRWLGDKAKNEIEAGFLDFLCCFKFELHSQMVLMEPELKQGKQLITVKPRTLLLRWMKSAVIHDEELCDLMEKVNVTDLAENSTVVVKNFKSLKEVKPFIQRHYRPIYEVEMCRMCDDKTQWPVVDSYELFSKYFVVEVHTQLIHLS